MLFFGSFSRAYAGALLILLVAGCGGSGGGSSASGEAQAGTGSRPTIQGQPRRSVAIGRTYSFQPVASGRGNERLAFSVTNLPSWLTLNASTGRISGAPAAGDLGTYSGVVLTVSDGVSSSTLGPFSIAVVTAGTGTAALSWTPPVLNTNGSVLTDLAGYVVLFGDSPTEFTESIVINNAGIANYVVDELTDGAWFFTVQAFSASGARSEASPVVSKTI